MFTFHVRPDAGEPFDVKATSRDVYVWEKSGRGRSLKTFAENVNLSDAYAICHIAARRQQLTTAGLEDFALSADIDFDQDEPEDQEPDPFRPDPSAGA